MRFVAVGLLALTATRIIWLFVLWYHHISDFCFFLIIIGGPGICQFIFQDLHIPLKVSRLPLGMLYKSNNSMFFLFFLVLIFYYYKSVISN